MNLRSTPAIVILLIASFSIMAAVNAQALTWSGENIPTADTLLLYQFNGSGTTVIDAGPLGKTNGMNNSAARAGIAPDWLDSPSGDYISQPAGLGYEGATNRVTMPVDFDNGLTLDLWMKFRTNETQVGTMIYTESPRTLLFVNNVGTFEGKIFIQRLTSNSIPYEVKDNDFHQVAVVYDPVDGDASNGGLWHFYVDNALIDSIPDTNNLSIDPDISLTVGKNYYGGAVEGVDYDEFLVENAVLTDFSVPNGTVVDNDDDDDGIPNAWETAYFGCSTCATGTDDPDLDGVFTYDEYVFDTNPTNSASSYSNEIISVTGTGTFELKAGPPTSPDRIYDVYKLSDLTESPQQWMPVGLNVPGIGAGSAVTLTITNDQVNQSYRTGVTAP